MEWPWEYQSIRTFVSAKGAMGCFPLKSRGSEKNRYRMILLPKDAKDAQTSEISIDEFRAQVQKLSPQPIQIHSGFWLTRFQVHHRIASTFQKGRAFLCGDAAHIHSPVGGQGMNIGIQDAINLGRKIKSVMRNHQPIASLRDYEKERMPVARRVLRGTDLFFRMALIRESALTKVARKLFMGLLIKSGIVQRRMLTAVSEVRIARKEIERGQTKAPKQSAA